MPIHGNSTLKIGTLHGILRDIELSVTEFEKRWNARSMFHHRKNHERTQVRIARARRIDAQLTELYPDARCALHHNNPLQLLVATILSAQCTDVRVNLVTPALFARYPDVQAFADAKLRELQALIKSTGFFRNKAKNIRACCRALVKQHAGEVPRTMGELVPLPGVGRKTANVILGNAFGVPGIPVDTHVGRLSRRMGLTEHDDPVKVEAELMELIAQQDWTMFGHRMIYHGRQVCHSRKPKCNGCAVRELCPRVGVED